MFEYFNENCISLESAARNKQEMLKEISRLAVKSPLMKNLKPEEIEAGLKERERVSSTGLENGIAIPHCSFDNLDSFLVGLVTKREGLDFDSIDGKPAKLIFYIIGPEKERNTHIRIISSIAKLAEDKKLMGKLLNTEKSASLYSLLKLDIEEPEITNTPEEFCQFMIQVQDEDLFTNILEAVSADSDGAISVLETNTAGYYLHKLPLFSTFWTTSVPNYSRIIFAVINKKLMNRTLRRIHMIRKDRKAEQGVLITVQDILYRDGSIDF